MDQKNIETVLSALAEKIRDLELEVSLREYEIERLKKENEELRWHLNPIGKREDK